MSDRRVLGVDYESIPLMPSPPDRRSIIDPFIGDAAALDMARESFDDLEIEEFDYEAGLQDIEAFYGPSPQPSPHASPEPARPAAEPTEVHESTEDVPGDQDDEFDGLMEDIEKFSTPPQEMNPSMTAPDTEKIFTSAASPQPSTPRRLSAAVFKQSPRAYSPVLPEEDPPIEEQGSAPSHGTPLPPSSGNRSRLQNEMRDEEREASSSPETTFGASLKERLHGAQTEEHALSHDKTDHSIPEHATSSTPKSHAADTARAQNEASDGLQQNGPDTVAHDTPRDDVADPDADHEDRGSVRTVAATMKRARQSSSPPRSSSQNLLSPTAPPLKKQKVKQETQPQSSDQKPARELRSQQPAATTGQSSSGTAAVQIQQADASRKTDAAHQDAKPNATSAAHVGENSDSSLSDLSEAPHASPTDTSRPQLSPSTTKVEEEAAITAEDISMADAEDATMAEMTKTELPENPGPASTKSKSKPKPKKKPAPKRTITKSSTPAKSTPSASAKSTPKSANKWIRKNQELSSLIGDRVLKNVIQQSPRKTRGQRKADEDSVPSGAAAAKKRHSTGQGK